MIPKRFAPLHAHDGFSTFDGLGLPQEHIDFCRENGLDAWSMTNHGHMNSYGHAWLHVDKLNKAGGGFKLLPGCEMYLHPDLNEWKRDLDRSKNGSQVEVANPLTVVTDGDDETIAVSAEEVASLTTENEDETKSTKLYNPVNRRHHLVVIPRTSAALERLFGLVSRSYSEGYYRFPRIDYRMLKEAAQGEFFVSSACLTGDTELITDQGLQRLDVVVDRVNRGESAQVLSYNENTGRSEFKKVSWGAMTRKDAKLIRIKTKDGKSVVLTPDHKVFTNKGWMEASELSKTPGIKILSL